MCGGWIGPTRLGDLSSCVFVVRVSQEEYEREKIQWTFIEFPDNKDCIELIDRKPNGIIPTLDEQVLYGVVLCGAWLSVAWFSRTAL